MRDSQLELLAGQFRALADPVRLELLEFLLIEDHCLDDCSGHLGLDYDRLLPHLVGLADLGYIRSHRDGACNVYGVTVRAAEVIELARELATERGAALSACSRVQDAADRSASPP